MIAFFGLIVALLQQWEFSGKKQRIQKHTHIKKCGLSIVYFVGTRTFVYDSKKKKIGIIWAFVIITAQHEERPFLGRENGTFWNTRNFNARHNYT